MQTCCRRIKQSSDTQSECCADRAFSVFVLQGGNLFRGRCCRLISNSLGQCGFGELPHCLPVPYPVPSELNHLPHLETLLSFSHSFCRSSFRPTGAEINTVQADFDVWKENFVVFTFTVTVNDDWENKSVLRLYLTTNLPLCGSLSQTSVDLVCRAKITVHDKSKDAKRLEKMQCVFCHK